MAVKTAVVMKVRMTLSLPLIFLLMISGESQLLQHHFQMFSAIAHIKYPLYSSNSTFIQSEMLSACQSLCVFMFVDIRLTSLEGVA